MRPSPPRSALLLGWAGVLPFGALSLATAAGLRLPMEPEVALRAYAAAILSFMGGAQWGVAMRAPAPFGRAPTGYAVSVGPALLAAGSLLVPWRAGLVGLAAGFAGLLAYDLWTVRRGFAPDWYAPLRIRLTAAVLVLLLVAAALG